VLSNGQAGIHVERSWFVTVEANSANGNGRFGIEFYHGDLLSISHGEITGNSCSYNGQVGIILNSGTENVISGNTCLNNSGTGILLYNDVLEGGSSSNTLTHNVVGDDRQQASQRTQAYGIRETNQADANLIEYNVVFGDLVKDLDSAGPTTVSVGNIEG